MKRAFGHDIDLSEMTDMDRLEIERRSREFARSFSDLPHDMGHYADIVEGRALVVPVEPELDFSPAS